MKKILLMIMTFSLMMNFTLLNKVNAKVNEETQIVKLCEVDLTSTKKQVYEVELPNGTTGTVTIEDIPVASTNATHYTLSGKFNKRFTFTESSPLMTISAIYSGNVTFKSVKLNKPKSGRMSGAINYESGEYSVGTYKGSIKEAIFTAKYSFPVVGTSHYMQLILRVAPKKANNATLYTNGVF